MHWDGPTVGREAELAELHARLRPARLVTIVGPPGVGKSHLAREVIAEWETPTVTVELDSQQPAEAIGAIRDAIASIAPSGIALDDRLAWLASQPALLVIDAAEVARAAVADLIRHIHGPAARLAILCTSTVPLNLAHEDVLRIGPLAVPAGDIRVDEVPSWPGVALFVDLARRSGVSVESAPHRLATVVRLCRTLDGIPLALRLAAVRLRHLPLEELDRRMDQRFRWLRSPTLEGRRHDGLAIALQASHELLDDRQRRGLRWLSVFDGSFTLDDAAWLISADDDGEDPVDTVLDLVDRSFVVLDNDRYRLLQTIRAFGRDRLDEAGETAAARQRHLTWCLRAVDLDSHPAPIADRRRHADVVTAFEHAVATRQADAALRLAPSLWEVWERSGHAARGVRQLASALDIATPDAPGRTRVVAAAAELAMASGDLADAARLAADARASSSRDGDRLAEAGATTTLALVHLYSGSWTEAEQAGADAVALGQELGDGRAVGHALTVLGLVAHARGEFAEATGRLSRAIDSLLAADCRADAADVLHNLANVLIDRGDLAAARLAACKALDVRRTLDDDRGLGLALGMLVHLESISGSRDAPSALGDDAIAALRRSGDVAALGALLNNLANAARAAGDDARAKLLYDEARRTYLDLGDAAAAALVEANTPHAEVAGRRAPPAEPLSLREVEVLDLLAQGLDNRAIAGRLFISVRTVDAHLSHIRSKIGVTGRGALMRWALDRRELATPVAAHT